MFRLNHLETWRASMERETTQVSRTRIFVVALTCITSGGVSTTSSARRIWVSFVFSFSFAAKALVRRSATGRRSAEHRSLYSGHSRRMSSRLIPVHENGLASCSFVSPVPIVPDSTVNDESLKTKSARATVTKFEINPHRLSLAA
jgi:hypothetical protein